MYESSETPRFASYPDHLGLGFGCFPSHSCQNGVMALMGGFCGGTLLHLGGPSIGFEI
jgi:hypothetical protein